ncbi:hypothetical protein BC830DRAFT_1140291 [Chytriomyces sp. MP71]|nr:hypothetical protein BC830DRAFT_1140291 [Chytriomyces sp. MP71]
MEATVSIFGCERGGVFSGEEACAYLDSGIRDAGGDARAVITLRRASEDSIFDRRL